MSHGAGADDDEDDESGAYFRVLAPMRRYPSVDERKQRRRKLEDVMNDHRRARFGRRRVDATVMKSSREDMREMRVVPFDQGISYDLWLYKNNETL